jgi:hypothetical protein
MSEAERPQDPTSRFPQPDFPQQDQEHPNWTAPMEPPPDHGEDQSVDAASSRRAWTDSGSARATSAWATIPTDT